MKRIATFLLAAFAGLPALPAAAAQAWTEGRHYTTLQPAQRTSVRAGKVEVLEVFSYACVACNSFQPSFERLKKSLPPNAQVAYLHASFNSAESWPMFQRAFYAAQALGVAEKAHQAIYDAVWKTGELAVVDSSGRRLKNPQPALEDAAKVYARATGVKAQDFLATARSFAVDSKIRAADAQVIAMKVAATPTLVVNGRYRVEMQPGMTIDELIELVKFLVAKSGGG